MAEIHNNKETNNDCRCANTCIRGVFSVKELGHNYVFCRMPNVILGCGETTTLMLLLWCNIHGVNSTHRCHYTMAPADSKFDDLSDADIDSLTEDAIYKNTR